MYLEDSDGKIIDNPSEAQLVSVLSRIGNGLDHCVLTYTEPAGQEWFIQSAGSKAGLLLQYDDGSGLCESTRCDFDVATVKRVFMDAAKGGKAWKTEFSFRLADRPEQAAAAPGSAGPGPGGEKSLKDQVLDAVKQGSMSGAGDLIQKGVKSFFRKLF
jgi:hypothetical protein